MRGRAGLDADEARIELCEESLDLRTAKLTADDLLSLKAAKPDVVCLQELKAKQAVFPSEGRLSRGVDRSEDLEHHRHPPGGVRSTPRANGFPAI